MAYKLDKIVQQSRKELAARKRTGEWEDIARKTGLSYRTICALGRGAVREMVFTREVRLAKALGINVGVIE